MRDGWVETTLGDVAEWWSGGTPKAREPKYYKGGTVPWAVIADMNKGIINSTNSYITEEALELIGGRLAPVGSVLISMYASVGKSAIANIPLATNQAIAWSIPNQEKIIPFYLYLVSQQLEKEISDLARGATQRNINRQMLREFTFQLPPLSEQKRIVDLISSVDSYIEALQKELASAQSISSSISESLWSSFSLKSKLSSFGETLTGTTPPTKKLQYWESHDVDFFTPSDLGASLKLSTAIRGVSHQGAAISRPLKGFSVLQVCIGATIGKVGYLNYPAVMNQQINALTNLTEHDAPILAAILSSETFQSIIRNTAGGSTLPIISKSSWGEIQIPHVPRNERNKVSLTILESDLFIEQSRQLLLSAEKMRSAILHNLLTGTHEIPSSYDEVIGAA